jgi:hypothetical protein
VELQAVCSEVGEAGGAIDETVDAVPNLRCIGGSRRQERTALSTGWIHAWLYRPVHVRQ